MASFFLRLLFFLWCSSTFATDEFWHHIKQGNLALPFSQLPGPFLGFGQRVVPEHNLLGFIFPDFLLGRHKSYSEICPSIIYGIRNGLSLFVELPCAIDLKSADNSCSSGPEDLFIQLEFAPYWQKKIDSINFASLVAAVLMPTGDESQLPPTGYGSSSFLFGATAVHLSVNWYCYVSPFVLLTTSHGGGTKNGNMFYYQVGFGRNIHAVPDRWIFAWTIELSGTYMGHGKERGIVDADSGGNLIMLGPSLFFSTPHVIVQGGIAPIIYEHLNGSQEANDRVYVAFNLGWKFH